MKLNQSLVGACAVLAMAMSGSAFASLVGSSVNIGAENGFDSGTLNCKTASVASRTVVGAGELVAADWTGGCVGYYGADISAGAITLTGIESGNYSFAHFRMDIVSGAVITGASFGGYTSNFFQTGGTFNDTNFVPIVTFGANFVDVVWDSLGEQFVFNAPLNGGASPFGTATINVTSRSTQVPEPGTALLIGIALLCVGASRRARSRTL